MQHEMTAEKLKRRNRKIYILLFIGLLAASALFIAYGMTAQNFDFNFPRRSAKIGAIVLVSICIGYSSVAFQTMTENHILTPSVMGLDYLYMFLQTAVLFFWGAEKAMTIDDTFQFFVTLVIMVGASWLLYMLLFKGEGRNIYTLVLVGMVFGTLFNGLSSFMQLLIDPNEFSTLQSRSFASFKVVNTDLLGVSAIIVLVIMVISYKDWSKFDVLSLGKENAMSLGIDYQKLVLRTMMMIAVLVSVSTVLVGPVTFLGIILASLSRQIVKTYRHKDLFLCAILIGSVGLVLGEFILEKVLDVDTTLSVVVNFVGGVYFIGMLLKESRQ